MSLLNTANTAANSTPAWEDFDGDNGTAGAGGAATTTATAGAAAAAAAVTTAAVTVTKPSGGLSLGALGQGVTMESLFKNKLRVEYNTLACLIPFQGGWMLRETKKLIGDEINLQLLSYQDSYVVSPEDDKAPREVVRYSDDGINCSDGTSVAEHLAFLKSNGYPKAKLKERIIVVAALLKSGKPCDEVGGLVQLDLPPSSRTMWKRYEAGCALALMQADDKAAKAAELSFITASVGIATQGNNSYALATFKTTPA